MNCETTCFSYELLGMEACLGCAGDNKEGGDVMSRVDEIRDEISSRIKAKAEALRVQNTRLLNKMCGSIAHIHDELRADGRCKHGMVPMQCSYCKGMPMTKYAQSVGGAWIR